MRYLITFCLLLVLEVLYIGIAHRLHIVDRPNVRSSHVRPVVRGGGIIFMAAVWLWAVFFGWKYPWFLLGMTLISTISYIDDLKDEPKSVRLLIQFTAMIMMFHEHDILTPSLWWMILLELVFCVGVINAFNFMDGINGMLGGYSIVVLGALLYIDTFGLARQGLQEPFVAADFLAVCLLSAVVFCLFNFRRRPVCFAGDVGSVGMAFIVLYALGWLILVSSDVTYIMLLAVYGVDVVMTIGHRVLLHENLTEPHRKHAYQLLANELKVPHLMVSGGYMLLQALITAGLFFLPVNRWAYSAAVLLLLCLAYVLFMRKFYPLHVAYLESIKNKK